MNFYGIMPLQFLTPVHFGNAGVGGGLEAIYEYGYADTLFSALYREALRYDTSVANTLYTKCAEGSLRISDLFPWGKRKDNYHFYLPKPSYIVSKTACDSVQTWESMKIASTAREKNKKQNFLKASELSKYMKSLITGQIDELDTFVPEKVSTDVRVNMRTKEPYALSSCTFSENSGLYIICMAKEEKDLHLVENLLTILGYEGIGGRRSSGLGKFQLEDEIGILEGDSIWGGDDEIALYHMLNDGKADCQMSLSVLLPQCDEWNLAEKGSGQWLRRGGFAYDEKYRIARKTNSIYMMKAGTCLKQRLEGRIADVAIEEMGHPVYKYGKGMFAGIEVSGDEI